MDGILQNCAYSLLLTRYRLGLQYVNLRKFITELWTLTHLLNSLIMNQWNVMKLCICIDIDKLYVGIIIHQLLQISNRFMALNSC